MQRRGQYFCKLRGLLAPNPARRKPEVILRGRFGSIDAGSPLDHIQIKLENAPLRKNPFRQRDDRELDAFSHYRTAGRQKQVSNQLLRNCRSAAFTPISEILLHRISNFFPIEPVMMKEPCIFRRDRGVLQVRRNSRKRHERVVLRISMALDLYCRGRRINPSQENQCHYQQSVISENRPQCPAESALPARRFPDRFRLFAFCSTWHIRE
jgi:hypothetical protein